jgi:hypothetical protein
MWLTGFDAPCLHTMYADKPMQGHGLMAIHLPLLFLSFIFRQSARMLSGITAAQESPDANIGRSTDLQLCSVRWSHFVQISCSD